MQRPNVLLLYTDQQRWDTLRCAGNPFIHTPHLDNLAEKGALFLNAYCNNPVCMPSRQSMLSGRYPSSLGCTCNGIEMRKDVDTLATILGRHGYRTANIGKLHFKNHAHRDHRELHPAYGFDTLLLSDEPGCYEDTYIKWVERKSPGLVDACRCSTPPAHSGRPRKLEPRETDQPYLFRGPEELTHTAFVAEETATFIRQQDKQPFFCIAGFYAPHAPLNPPARFLDMVDIDALPLPAALEGQDGGHTPAEWRNIKAHYYALVMHVDDQIGRILHALEETGHADNTLIVFTSDHGEHLGDHGLIQKGPPGLDSCTHVPLVISGPGVTAGERFRHLIEAVDIAPTLLDACGVQTPPAMQGRSFLPLLEGANTYDPRNSVFIEFREPSGQSWKALRTSHYKYARCNTGEEQLFDLEHDPAELHDISAKPESTDILHHLRTKLLKRWFDVESQYPLRTGQY